MMPSPGNRHNGGPAIEPIEYVRPWLYAKQQRAIFDCPDINGNMARYGFTEASTKAGKTVGAMAWLFEQALIGGADGRNYWWVAPVYPQAKIAFRRLKRGLPKDLYKANEQDLTLTLPNGAVIWFKSGEKPDNLYGEDVWAAVIDEASRVREESWNAVRSTLTATRGPVRAIGNVKGRSNWFYRLCRKAEAGEPNMSYHKLTAYDAVEGGVTALEEVEDAKRLLPDNVFRELYLAEPSDDEGNPFGYKHIQQCLAPLSELPPAVCGVDLAKSIDWTVVLALDKFGGTCGVERWQSDWEATQRRILDLAGRTPTLVDSTGVGDPIFEALQKKRPATMRGFKFSSSSKQQLMEGLAVAIQQHTVTFPDGPIKAELENFEYVYTRTGVRYSAPEGYHDDLVVALALAVYLLRQRAPGATVAAPSGGAPRISPWLGAQSG
jgi:hypothetical protein